jgi:DNA-binding NarL/FixJ family response regulator
MQGEMMTIVFIDDDLACIEPIIDIVRAKHFEIEVVHFFHPKPALDYIMGNKGDIILVSLDVMFPSDGVNVGGFNLGLRYYSVFKEKLPKIPVIIFTNRDNLNGDFDEINVKLRSNKDSLISKTNIDAFLARTAKVIKDCV